MKDRKLPYWLRFSVAAAAVGGTIVSLALAIVAIVTAQAAKQTAEIAAREYALASKPAVFLTELTPTLRDKFDGSGTELWLLELLGKSAESPQRCKAFEPVTTFSGNPRPRRGGVM